MSEKHGLIGKPFNILEDHTAEDLLRMDLAAVGKNYEEKCRENVLLHAENTRLRAGGAAVPPFARTITVDEIVIRFEAPTLAGLLELLNDHEHRAAMRDAVPEYR